MYQRGEEEVVIALDAATGKTLWEHAYHAPITANMTNAPGPRATPASGRQLALHRWRHWQIVLSEQTHGNVVWSHDLFNEYKGYVQDEYYAASPLAYKNTIIVPVGAAGASIIAFDQKTGAMVWKKQDFKTSYASPILIKVDGQEQVVLIMESEIVGVEPNTGELLWSHPHRNRTKTNVSTPFWGADNLLFCSSAYDSGSRCSSSRSLRQNQSRRTLVSEAVAHPRANVIRLGETFMVQVATLARRPLPPSI